MSAFSSRHIGPSGAEIDAMLGVVGAASLDALIEETIPANIRLGRDLTLPAARTEEQALSDLRALMDRNVVARSHIGAGYHGTHTPAVIRRNILENPGWYTAYTPYQAEIAQGRLEALLNFQTMVCDLTGMEISNASLLDESTAAAEAMSLCHDIRGGDAFFVADHCHPQTIALLRTRAEPHGIRILSGPAESGPGEPVFGALFQYPASDGTIGDLGNFISRVHEAGALAVVAADLLALTLITPPGELGADIVVGSAQRFGVPPGFGGPHAAFLATRDEHKRRMPGRLVGVSKDAAGNPALRLALQTREQHIRREKATSNICTAQVLLAVMASMYAVYHGPEGLRGIAERVHRLALRLAGSLARLGHAVHPGPFFDTVRVWLGSRRADEILLRAAARGINLRKLDEHAVAIALDETTDDLGPLLEVFGANPGDNFEDLPEVIGPSLRRKTDFLTHPVFHSHHTETEMLRYIRRLEAKDLSLTTSMIPLGSCTMKLNAAAEMLPVTWESVASLHPLAPQDQAAGYFEMAAQLGTWLAEITGFSAVSLQPNAGSQGEYAGLLAIRAWHRSRGESGREVCLIPTSAHGTNPASAVMAGMRVVSVACDALGNIDLADLLAKADLHRDVLAAVMVTYPSTHGVFEEGIRELCDIVHAAGGQVYMDGANMNAQVGLCRPGDIGADVCHLNLHKTFCIPHGGGGPGVGPIGVAAHLAPFLPGHPLAGNNAVGPVAQAPLGSASILVISWMYIAMMGPRGLRDATAVAILNANYIAARLDGYFSVLFKGVHGRVAHECILDLREWKQRAGIEVEDVAKRLMDFGFHAPTMSWPVVGTLMVEPTESESRAELDRFCEAMITIHGELGTIGRGELDRTNNPLKNAPHTAAAVTADGWNRPYSRSVAAWPAPWLREHKCWPSVARIDNVYGDRHVFCSCPPVPGSTRDPRVEVGDPPTGSIFKQASGGDAGNHTRDGDPPCVPRPMRPE
ncbi:MAG: aminomethyl-transferring glycine dehydrogenase [Terrimicrobiaceae bacterium]|nr:aminomethyl-transferring glycine dehydrogenase [Terrimicrobiaceae bacterium]